MAEEGCKVSLNVYDLSQGLARQLSSTFLGKAIEGVWHTGVVVYGNEYYFGGGIQHAPVGATPYGSPVRVVDLGITHVPKELFEEYLQEISPRYTAETYSLLRHNCNNFSNEVTQFLVGTNIPDYILQLPNEVLSSPMGALILPMIQRLEMTLRAGAVPQTPQFQPSSLVQPLQATTTPANTNLNKSLSSGPSSRSSLETKDSKDEGVSQSDSAKEVHAADDKEAPAPETTMEKPEKMVNPVPQDRFGNARTMIQEEITREFAAIMATGTLRASEAAALAARRVMERHGRMDVTMQQS